MDYEMIMQADLDRVFGERDATRRIAAILEIYGHDAVLPERHRSAQGHDAISQAVTDLPEELPPHFTFTAIRPALGHHGIGGLPWRGRPPGYPVAVTGTDVAQIEGGCIQTLQDSLNQPAT